MTTDFLNTDKILLAASFRRGLNPPHRVKSISMTTFTQQEIEFLQKHGNEVSILWRISGGFGTLINFKTLLKKTFLY